MAVYTSAFTGEEIDTILAAVGTVATTQSNLDTDCDTVISKLTDILTALGSINTTLDPDPVETIYNSSVAASTTISNITAIDTSLLKKLWVFVDQTASESLTVNVRDMSTTSATTSTILQPMTLNATTLSASCYFIDLPPAIKIEIINNDSAHATTVTVKIVKTR